MSEKWFVAQLFDRVDSVALRMWQDGHETFPKIDVDAVEEGGKRLVDSVLYPGYIFVRFTERWLSARHIWGVAKVLGYENGTGFHIHLLSGEFIDNLRHPQEETEQTAQARTFKKGDFFHIRAGAENPVLYAFTGCFGHYHEYKTENPPKSKQGWIAVELDFFRRKEVVYFPPHCLELA